jgi:hypothetical protein
VLRPTNRWWSSLRRANCARQYGHMNPRRKASTTGFFPRKSDSRTRFPLTSVNSKSGAGSPGVINLLVIYPSNSPKIPKLLPQPGATVLPL